MTKEIDASIFDESSWHTIESVDQLGLVNEITKVGNLYSLNLGIENPDRRDLNLYRLLVLDPDKKTFNMYGFMNMRDNQWSVNKKSLDPRFQAPGSADAIYEGVTKFFSKIKEILPGMENEEATKVVAALKEGTQPLANFLYDTKQDAKDKLNALNDAFIATLRFTNR